MPTRAEQGDKARDAQAGDVQRAERADTSRAPRDLAEQQQAGRARDLRPDASRPAAAHNTPQQIAALQRTLGNRAVQDMLASQRALELQRMLEPEEDGDEAPPPHPDNLPPLPDSDPDDDDDPASESDTDTDSGYDSEADSGNAPVAPEPAPAAPAQVVYTVGDEEISMSRGGAALGDLDYTSEVPAESPSSVVASYVGGKVFMIGHIESYVRGRRGYKGVGAALIYQGALRAEALGLRTMYVLNSTVNDFYIKLGFSLISGHDVNLAATTAHIKATALAYLQGLATQAGNANWLA